MKRDDGSPERIVRRLTRIVEDVPEALRQRIIALGSDAVGPLVEMLESEDEGIEVRSGGLCFCYPPWHIFNAAVLLADLRAAGGAEMAVRRLEKALADDRGWLWDKLGIACGRFGAGVVEPMLAAYARSGARGRGRGEVLYAGILSHIGVRDDRIFAIIATECRGQPSFCDMLGHYGDPRGLPIVLRELENARVCSPPCASDWCELEPAFDAVKKLGGQLTPRLEWIRDASREAYERVHRERARAEGRLLN